MAISADVNFIFIPKATLILDQITFACIIATPKYIFIVPKEGISGQGRTINTTKYTINSTDPITGIQEYIQNKDLNIKDLEDFLNKILFEDLNLQKDQFFIEIAKHPELMIKASFFSKGIYYKKTGAKGYTGIAISGKDNAIKLKNFYGK